MAVAGGQIVNGFHNSICSRARPCQISGLINTRGDNHRIMFATDLLKADVNADIAVGDDFDAALLKLGHALHNHIFFELKSRYTIGQKPSRTVIAIIYCDLHTSAA